MKLKTWLLLSYFIVMALPLIAVYLLFAWISSYSEELEFEEYLKTTNELQDITDVLDDPDLYYPKVAKKELEYLEDQQRLITLYNQNGLIIYTSIPGLSSTQFSLNRDQLYEDLYKVKQGFSTYEYKQPVFEEGSLVGFFHIEFSRGEWTKGVTDRSWLMLGLFVLFFGLIYLSIIRFVNRKLNHRLTGLMDEMTAFAHGVTVSKTPTNKDEIGQLTEHFYAMRKQVNLAKEVIEQEQQEKEYMVATISHDLKTPLTSIKAYAEAIGNGYELTVEEQMEYRHIIMEKADFMQQMLDDLLTYTLLRSPTYEMDFVQVDGSEFFDMLTSDYEALCMKKRIALHTSTDMSGSYMVNPKQMMRVTDNLMSNAIQHTVIGGSIWLAAISETDSTYEWLFDFAKEKYTFDFINYAYIIVQNEGKGIAEEAISDIFDPLYQTDEARSKQADHGTGLGLSITKQIIEKHGGHVELLSKESVGTIVICRISKMKGV